MPRPFSDTLLDIRAGRTHDELSEALPKLVEEVERTGKSGSITLTLTVKPNGPSSVFVESALKVKNPEPSRGQDIFFINPDHSLTQRDPRQLSLDGLREVEAR